MPCPRPMTRRTRWNEEVNVTAGRAETRVGETAARVVVLDAEALVSAAFTLDDALRQVPGFTLFRRTGSRAANPTAQGASLRGVGPSGAGRTLVLVDGVPANDAFGGWVYWSRLPRIALERVEVMEGGASDLYGSDALGGVVQALGRTDAPAVSVEASARQPGHGTHGVLRRARGEKWSARAWGEAATTDGYVLWSRRPPAPWTRPLGARHLSGDAARGAAALGGVDRVPARLRDWARAGPTERRCRSTTPTGARRLPAPIGTPAGRGRIALRTWYGSESYHQTFSAVAAGRAEREPDAHPARAFGDLGRHGAMVAARGRAHGARGRRRRPARDRPQRRDAGSSPACPARSRAPAGAPTTGPGSPTRARPSART